MSHTYTSSTLVSVIMPNYNGAPYIGAAIASVQAQSYDDWELLICDDGSTDDSVQVVQALAANDARIRLITQIKQGVGYARNHAIAQANGRYIAFLDSDDVWQPHKLQVQLAFMHTNGAVFCHGWYHVMDAHERVTEIVAKTRPVVTYDDVLRGGRLDCLTLMVDRAHVHTVSFKETAQEDTVWVLDMLASGHASHVLPMVLGSYRVLAHSRSSRKLRNALDVWRILKAQPIGALYRVFCFIHYFCAKALLHTQRRRALAVSHGT